MELSNAQYTALQALFPGQAVDVLSSEDKTVILITGDTSGSFDFTNPEDQAALREEARLEAEAERVEQEAIALAARQISAQWEQLTPKARLEFRMAARRKLGL